MKNWKQGEAAPVKAGLSIGRLESWHIVPSNAQNFDFLDGIRGIAILMVVFSHLFYINPDSTGIVKFVGNTLGAGHLGVTVFFTLSGFLISLPFWKQKFLGKPIQLKNYFLRRFWKIYPPLALSVILFVPCYIWIYGADGDYAQTALKWLSGIAWLMPVPGNLNPVMWSLIVEVHFYVILPLAFISMRKASYRTTVWIIFFGLLLVPPIAKTLYAMRGLEFALHPLIHVNFPVKMDAFAAGFLISGLYQQGNLNPRIALFGPFGIILLAITLMMSGVVALLPSISNLWTPDAAHYSTMLASACMLCFVVNSKLAGQWGLSLSCLRWIGLISYEWYLFHQAPHIWLRAIMGPADGDLVKYLTITMVPFFGSLVLAAAVYWKFSLPILRTHRR